MENMENKKWTIMELREYVNSLSNEEFDKFNKEFDTESFDIDLDLVQLLSASRLYDYLQYKHGDNIKVELI